jgi:hypothetical protein
VAARQRRQSRNIASSSRADDSADADDRDGPLRRRSRDRVVYLANRRCFAMHQAARLLTLGQAAKVDALKSASQDFTAMRRLAMRFRGILRSKDIQKFGVWLDDAQQSGISQCSASPELCGEISTP